MTGLTTTEVLRTWDAGSSLQRAVRVLSVFELSGTSLAEALRIPVGVRDAQLIEVRSRTFGPKVNCTAECAGCREIVETEIDLDQLGRELPPCHSPNDLFHFEDAGYQVQFRLPNSQDLLSVAEYCDVEDPALHLLERCCVQCSAFGEPVPPNSLPESVVMAISERMAVEDPQADIQLVLTCPGCGHIWNSTFDIAELFWDEIDYSAKRILHEVNVLALAYGWSESAILNMSPHRRRCYLEMVS